MAKAAQGKEMWYEWSKSVRWLPFRFFLTPLPVITHIAVDGSGNVVVVGTSPGESPLFYGQHWGQFVAKLNSNGQLQWRRLGAQTYWGVPTTVAVDALGSIYVGGWGGCFSVWNVHVGDGSWVGKLGSSGADVWMAHVDCSFENGGPQARTLFVDAAGNTHLTGRSPRSWGNPVNPINPPAEGQDAFVVKLNSNGSLAWNTFMGSPSEDVGYGIAVDPSGNVYVSGGSDATWGTPVDPRRRSR